MQDQREYDDTTAILQFRHWYVFIPILGSLTLLALAALVTLLERLAMMKPEISGV